MVIEQEIVRWLLDSDPAIRWQVMKDILQAPPAAYEQERAQLTHRGWCAQLLHLQDKDGLWNRSIYNGKWISTTYSLYLLKILGLSPGNPQALMACDQLIAQGLYQEEEIRFSRNKDISDLGVCAMVLSLCCYFGHDVAAIPRMASFLISQQRDEGNWLPNESPSSINYSFETTLLVLEGLLQFQNRYTATEGSGLSSAVEKGQEFLLRHQLGLGEQAPIKSQWASLSFPPYWFYDILTALDYFYAFRANKDSRIESAIYLLRRKRARDGAWNLGKRHAGKTYFEMETPAKLSRWNTLRALRILEWWDSG